MENRQPRKRGSTPKRRRGARQKAMQALYQWDFDRAAQEPAHIVRQFCDLQNMAKVDVEYFEALFLYATEHSDEIDAEISSHMERPLEQLDPVERSVLRICCTELMTRLDAPYKVVVNEALEISKDFGADKGYRYINGIADKLAASLRKTEYQKAYPDGNPRAEHSSETERTDVHAAKSKTGNVKITIKEKTADTGKHAEQKQASGRSKARPEKSEAKHRDKKPTGKRSPDQKKDSGNKDDK